MKLLIKKNIKIHVPPDLEDSKTMITRLKKYKFLKMTEFIASLTYDYIHEMPGDDYRNENEFINNYISRKYGNLLYDLEHFMDYYKDRKYSYEENIDRQKIEIDRLNKSINTNKINKINKSTLKKFINKIKEINYNSIYTRYNQSDIDTYFGKILPKVIYKFVK
jgi:hypothetical protein